MVSWKWIVRIAVFLIVVVGLAITIRDAVNEFSGDAAKSQLLQQIQWQFLAMAAGLYAASLLPAAFYWYLVLRRFEVPVLASRAIAAHIQGHLGKYVPGKAMVVVLRVGGIAGTGVSPLAATVSVFVETLTMMATGATLAGVIIFAADVPAWLSGLALGLVFAASLPTIPPLFRKVLRVINRKRVNVESLAGYDWATFATGWGWMSLTWVLIGTAFATIVYAIAPASSGSDLLIASAAMALAVVAGFVSLLPGGAGVRELILAAVLAPRIGPAEALTAALLARVVFLAVELLAAVIAAMFNRAARSSAAGDRMASPTDFEAE